MSVSIFDKNSKMWNAGECKKGSGRNPIEVVHRILEIMPTNVQELAVPILAKQCDTVEYCAPENIVQVWDNMSRALQQIDKEHGIDEETGQEYIWVQQMVDIFNAKV